METLGSALAMALHGAQQFDAEKIRCDLSPEDAERKLLQAKCDSYNAHPGDLNEVWKEARYDCPKCKNRGRSMRVRENDAGDLEVVAVPCECMVTRESILRLAKSGLKGVTRLYTFKRYEAAEPWQQNIKNLAMDYVTRLEAGENGWFFIGGQSGAGKTHICTAIAVQAIKQGKSTRYMVWRDELRRLKAAVNSPEYGELLRQWQETQVLYIDDFLKAGRGPDGRMNPTQSDITIAFELLNYRMVSGGATIISSEMTLNEIADIDEATAGRIAQKTKGHCINIARKKERNYRLKGVIEV